MARPVISLFGEASPVRMKEAATSEVQSAYTVIVFVRVITTGFRVMEVFFA